MPQESMEEFNLNNVLTKASGGVIGRLEGIGQRHSLGKSREGDQEEAEALNHARNLLDSPDLFSDCTSREDILALAETMAEKESGFKKEGWEWVREFARE